MTDGKRSYIGHSLCRLAIKVKAGATGCNIICPELDETLADAAGTYKTGVTGADKKGLFEGEQSNPDKEYDANGDMYLTWYLQISNKNVSSQPFNFTLTNQLNSQNDYITHFQLKVVNPRLNPLWYVATGNVKGTSMVNGAWEFGEPTEPGSRFSWTETSTNFSAGGSSNANYDGWRQANVPGPDGVKYHMPTLGEYASIIPTSMTTTSGENKVILSGLNLLYTYSNTNTNPIYALPATAENTVYTEIGRGYFGAEGVKDAGITIKSYWGAIKSSGSLKYRYGIRYIGTDHCSVWYYAYDESGGIVTIKSKIIDRIEETDGTTLKNTLSEIEDAVNPYDWSENNDVVIRQFRTFGYSNTSTAIDQTDKKVGYTSVTWRWNGNSNWNSDNYGLYFAPENNGTSYSVVWAPGNRAQSLFSIRLFRDE